MKNISIILPTRGRSALVKRLFESLAETTAKIEDIEVILYLDDDDIESHGIGHSLIDVIKLIRPHGAPLGTILNECYHISSGRYLFLMNDDVIFRTKGWDTAIFSAFCAFKDDIALIYGNDLDQRGKVPTFPVLSRKTCDLMGRVCPAEYLNLHIESHILDIFKRLRLLGHDRIIYLDGVVFEHMHYQLGKQAYDATYKKKNQDLDDWHFLSYDVERELVAKKLAQHIDSFGASKKDAYENSGSSVTVRSGRPEVSVIIPDFLSASMLEINCLNGIKDANASCKTSIEVILAADKSGMSVNDARLSGMDVTFAKKNANGSFISACNECIAGASGEFVIFLSFRALPQAGWLDAMISVMALNAKNAVVGPMFLDPRTGRVAHIGVCFYEQSGALTSTRVYNGLQPDHPAVIKSREFQAIAPFCMMVKKEQFIEAGGFDVKMMGAATADLCLKIRENGWKVLYAPQSRVVLDYEALSGENAGNTNDTADMLYKKWNGRIERDLNRVLKEDGFSIIKRNGHLIVN